MRVAVIADIHGNYHALDAVLSDLATLGVDEIIVNGDSVNRGPDSVAVMHRLRNVPHKHTLGNHDDLMLMAHEPVGENSWLAEPFWNSARYVANELADADLLAGFRNMPRTVRVTHEDHNVLIAHGSPRHYREGLGKFLKPEVLSEIVEEYPADILIGSHTHRPYLFTWGPHTVLNSGAVGMPFNGDRRAQYLLLTFNNGAWDWAFRRVPYDVDAAIAHFLQTDYYAAGGLPTKIFAAEMQHARSFLAPFTMFATERGLGTTYETWEAFQEHYRDRFTEPVQYEEISETKEVLS